MKTPLILMDWENTYGNSYPAKSLLYIQCNSHQNASVIFTETETNEQNPKVHLKSTDSRQRKQPEGGKTNAFLFLICKPQIFIYIHKSSVYTWHESKIEVVYGNKQDCKRWEGEEEGVRGGCAQSTLNIYGNMALRNNTMHSAYRPNIF